jgi:hypothetical protein
MKQQPSATALHHAPARQLYHTPAAPFRQQFLDCHHMHELHAPQVTAPRREPLSQRPPADGDFRPVQHFDAQRERLPDSRILIR